MKVRLRHGTDISRTRRGPHRLTSIPATGAESMADMVSAAKLACTSLRLHAAVINTLLPLMPVVQREKMGYSLTFLSSSFSKTLLFYAEAPSAENI